jgi:hypothetical protein
MSHLWKKVQEEKVDVTFVEESSGRKGRSKNINKKKHKHYFGSQSKISRF